MPTMCLALFLVTGKTGLKSSFNFPRGAAGIVGEADTVIRRNAPMFQCIEIWVTFSTVNSEGLGRRAFLYSVSMVWGP